MKTVIYLSNQTVKVITGEEKRGVLVVTGTFSEEAPKLSIVNGQVTDDRAFTSFLKEFWENYQLPKKDVYLIVNSTQTVIRFFELPGMSHRKMMEYLPREFSDVDRMREPVYGYGILGKGKSVPMMKMFGVMMERNFLQEHISRFQVLGIRIISVEAELTAKLHLLERLEHLQGKVCGVLLLEGITLLSVLWVNHSFLHFNRTRLTGGNKKELVGEFCARGISSLVQFARAQRIADELQEIYAGGMKDEEFSCCEAALSDMTQGLKLYRLEQGAGNGIKFSGGSCDLGTFGAAIGGLCAQRGKENLLHQYHLAPEFVERQKERLKLAAPALFIMALLFPVLLFQAVNWFRFAGQINQCLDQLSDPQVLAGAARYEKLKSENITMRRQIEEAERAEEIIGSYPVMAGEIDKVVEHCAYGLVTAEITGFQASKGLVQVSGLADDEMAVHTFIERLAEERQIFSNIHYTGFEYVENDGAWRLWVDCYLKPAKGEETAK